MQYPKIVLKRNKEESLQRKHPWIFSGAIERSEGNPEEGDIVEVVTSKGDFVALGHCQIGSIAVRVLSFSREPIDSVWWTSRLMKAMELRGALGLTDNPNTTCYRLVHGEGDMLPELIIDIYSQTAVVQCHSVGMYFSRDQICFSLRQLYGDKLRAIYDKSSQSLPFNAELDAVDGYLWRNENKSADDSLSCDYGIVMENGCRFSINWERGQKTGFFYRPA